jgi:hypothetical protein
VPEGDSVAHHLGGLAGRRVVPGGVAVDVVADLDVVVAGDPLPEVSGVGVPGVTAPKWRSIREFKAAALISNSHAQTSQISPMELTDGGGCGAKFRRLDIRGQAAILARCILT